MLKLYHEEPGTEEVQNLISKNVAAIYASQIAQLEMRSAIWKKVRTNELTPEAATAAISYFEHDAHHFLWIEIDREIIESATRLLMRYGQDGLRSLDSLQLASALSLQEKECMYSTFDSLLKKFFIEAGLEVI